MASAPVTFAARLADELISVWIYCAKCDVLPVDKLERGDLSEMRFFVSRQQLTVLRSMLPSARCLDCDGPIEIKVFSELKLVRDDPPAPIDRGDE